MSSYFAELGHEALLHLQGADALAFLQGQVTCDTRKLTPGSALPGTYCTPNGRVVCDFLLCEAAGEHLLMRLRRDIRASSAALFAKYIIFSRARLEAEREDWQVLGCWGRASADRLQTVFGAVPRVKYGATRGEGFVLVQLDDAGTQFECYLERDAGTALAPLLRENMQPGGASEWRALQIASGIARIEAGTSGEFIPQMLNYDLTGHISFNKGCYTGQEVVARMHYRGKPKRRLHLAELALADPGDSQQLKAGDPLYTGNGAQAVGNVVNFVTTADGLALMLVTATAEGMASGLHLAAADGPLLRTKAVPYPIPEK